MDFRALKSKLHKTDNNSTDINLATLSETLTNDHQTALIAKLQKDVEYKEATLNIFMKHVLLTFDANIDDMKLLLDQKRPQHKMCHLSVCDLWIRLKTIEQMEPFSLVTYLRTYQLQRPEIKQLELTDDCMENEAQYISNPRRSRLTHFHICAGSDEFDFNAGGYVGLLVFSYDSQSKFILGGHHCQRGDIIIKQIKTFSHTHSQHRGIYDALFKWYFNRAVDEKFFGIGFLYVHGKWRFDLITYDERNLLTYEYRLFDMFLLTHWLTHSVIPPHHVQQMETNAKDLFSKQYDIVNKKLTGQERSDLSNVWNEVIGSDENDLQTAVKRFLQTTEREIETVVKLIGVRNKNIFA